MSKLRQRIVPIRSRKLLSRSTFVRLLTAESILGASRVQYDLPIATLGAPKLATNAVKSYL